MEQWGSQIDFLTEIEENTGHKPQALIDRPTLEEPLLGFYKIYLDVTKGRAHDMGSPQGVSNRQLLDYFELYSVPKWEWAEITHAVTRIDTIWMTVQLEAQKRAQQAGKTS